MPLTLNLAGLTTRADCDEALASLEAELDTYQHRDSNLSFADRQATRATDSRAGRLADAQAEVAMYTDMLKSTTITPRKRKDLEIQLRKANDRKDNLSDGGSTRTGAAAVLAAVDAAQNEGQVAILREATAQVQAHRATLPA